MVKMLYIEFDSLSDKLYYYCDMSAIVFRLYVLNKLNE